MVFFRDSSGALPAAHNKVFLFNKIISSYQECHWHFHIKNQDEKQNHKSRQQQRNISINHKFASAPESSANVVLAVMLLGMLHLGHSSMFSHLKKHAK
jgi:hypothetical protein